MPLFHISFSGHKVKEVQPPCVAGSANIAELGQWVPQTMIFYCYNLAHRACTSGKN